MRRSLLVVLIPIVVASTAAPTRAEWVPDGAPVCTAAGNQTLGPQAIADDVGGVFLLWRQSPAPFPAAAPDKDIFLQHFGYWGAPASGWPVDGKPFLKGDGLIPPAVGDQVGGLLVAWGTTNYPESDIYATRMTSEGLPAPGWSTTPLAVCTATGQQAPGFVARDGYGGMFVAWSDFRAGGSNPDLYVHHVLATGTVDPDWPVNGLGVSTGAWAESPVGLVTDGLTGVLVVWRDTRLGIDDPLLRAQRLTPEGAVAPGWPAGGMSIAPGAKLFQNVAAVPDSAGGVIVVWDDTRHLPATSRYDIFAQHVTGGGSIAPGWPADGVGVCTADIDQIDPGAIPDGVGGAIIGWLDSRDFPGTQHYAYYAARILPDGTVAPGWLANGTPVATTPVDFFDQAPIAADGLGGAFFTWGDDRDPFNRDIYAQRLTANGTIAAGWQVNGLPVCSHPAYATGPIISEAGPARAIVAWNDLRDSTTTGVDLFAQEVLGDAPVAIQVSLASSDVGSNFARLAWYTADGSLARATVERRGTSGDWETRATVYPDGSGRMTYDDRDVVAGTRYGYRLAWTEPAGDQHSGETWLDIPALALAIAGFSRNPSSGSPSVSMTLASDAPATLEVLDVTGRRLARHDLGGLGAGRHSVPIATRAPLAAGVYVLRLTQAGRTVTAKGVVFQ